TLNAILQEAAAALRRYFDLIDEAPTIREAPNAAPLTIGAGEVRFEGVRFRYRPDAPALEGIDLTVPAGRRTALVGRSGSGKSSLLNL
ncbi:ATP-binding cassette domain-containing protein, partial [Serratia marcescens]